MTSCPTPICSILTSAAGSGPRTLVSSHTRTLAQLSAGGMLAGASVSDKNSFARDTEESNSFNSGKKYNRNNKQDFRNWPIKQKCQKHLDKNRHLYISAQVAAIGTNPI